MNHAFATRLGAIGLALIAAAAIGGPASATDPKVTLSFGDVNTKDSPVGKSVLRLGELMKERTGGTVTIDYFERSQLGNERELVEKVKSGAVDMADISTGVLSSFVGGVGLVTLPYLLDSREHGIKVLKSEIGQAWAKEFTDKHNVHLFGYFAGSVRDLYTRKPINAVQDFKGLKIRVVESPVYVSFVKALGALPTPVPASEIYSALQTGVVDGTDVGSATYVTQKIYEQAPCVAKMKWLYGYQGILMSDRSWRRLSEAQRQALTRSLADAEQFSVDTYNAFDQTIYDALVAKNQVTVTHPDIAAIRAAVELVYENEWNAKYGKDAIARVRAMAR